MLKIENKFDPNRLYHGYYLDKYEKGLFDKKIDPCDRCEISDICDRIADDLNCIEYCICLDGIKDKEYKDKYPESYFKKVDQ